MSDGQLIGKAETSEEVRRIKVSSPETPKSPDASCIPPNARLTLVLATDLDPTELHGSLSDRLVVLHTADLDPSPKRCRSNTYIRVPTSLSRSHDAHQVPVHVLPHTIHIDAARYIRVQSDLNAVKSQNQLSRITRVGRTLSQNGITCAWPTAH